MTTLSPASELAAREARRKNFDQRTIDLARVDEANSEARHQLRRETATDGYFEGRRTRRHEDRDRVARVPSDRSARQGVRAAAGSHARQGSRHGEVPGAATGNRRRTD